MIQRIIGLETEYGCLVNQESPAESPEEISFRIKDYILKKKKLGLVDLHQRAHDEPPGNGGFLLNGGRIYLDMGHLEYASPECISLSDIVSYDRAGDLILQEALTETGFSENVSIIKNNIDHHTGSTFGSHENYLVSRDFPFTYEGLGQMIPFLVTRQIFTGSGRVGAHFVPDGWILLGESKFPEVNFQLSQRADHIVNDFYQWVQFNRAIINTRDEPLADPSRYRRIHLLLGDSNMLEYATALKLGTTSLMLSLIEEGFCPEGLMLQEPVLDLKQISRDATQQWVVTLENGHKLSAIELQSKLQRAAKKHLSGKDPDADWVIAEWGKTLEALANDPYQLVGKIDWISKKWLIELFLKSEEKSWNDPWAISLDLEYHNLNPDKGLSFALGEEREVTRQTSDPAIRLAMDSPPRNTRASARGEIAKSILEKRDRKGIESKNRYLINWTQIQIEGKKTFSMEDPFNTYIREANEYLAG
ncbi:MAG: proteasome accessory factor PafA2 family protein [Nitrospirae bacterium]|nr:proteasome accessory factor PafA2 family protein [Nitrospirota bacterium]MBI3595419.1 proteasome accessory factor PafA2 family protein [Nitrospirota bacterium]